MLLFRPTLLILWTNITTILIHGDLPTFSASVLQQPELRKFDFYFFYTISFWRYAQAHCFLFYHVYSISVATFELIRISSDCADS